MEIQTKYITIFHDLLKIFRCRNSVSITDLNHYWMNTQLGITRQNWRLQDTLSLIDRRWHVNTGSSVGTDVM